MTVKSTAGLGCFMVTEVITWRMDQGVTMMMKVRETAERDLTKLAFISAFTVSLMGLLAACVPSSTGKAAHSAVLPRRDIIIIIK